MCRRIILCVLGILLLSSCTPKETLPPEEVFIRSQLRNQDIQSVNFSIDGTYEYLLENSFGTGEGKAHIEGTLQDGGKQVYSVVDTTVESEQADGVMSIHANFESIVVTPGETYVKVQSLGSEPQHPFFSPDLLDIVLGRWWIIPSQESSVPDMSLTPKPQLLKAQSEVVRMRADLGMDRIRDRRAYHYEVELDPEKLQAFLVKVAKESGDDVDLEEIQSTMAEVKADGEIWVDAETFDMLRIQWQVKSLPIGGNGSAALLFTIDLVDHNSAEPVPIPQDAKPFTMEIESIPQDEGGALPSFPSEWEEELIKKLLDSGGEELPFP